MSARFRATGPDRSESSGTCRAMPNPVPSQNCLDRAVAGKVVDMIVVGLVLLLLGLLLSVPILWTLGVIVLIVGLVLLLLGSTGRAVGGRRHYW